MTLEATMPYMVTNPDRDTELVEGDRVLVLCALDYPTGEAQYVPNASPLKDERRDSLSGEEAN